MIHVAVLRSLTLLYESLRCVAYRKGFTRISDFLLPLDQLKTGPYVSVLCLLKKP